MSERPGYTDHRPWGRYTILSSEADHKVKRMEVDAGHRLSLQRHTRRAEHWYVLRGRALVHLDGAEIFVGPGQAVDVPLMAWHRVGNDGPEDLVFIEVQTGTYFGEDDIERREDDYGRI